MPAWAALLLTVNLVPSHCITPMGAAELRALELLG